MAEADNRWGGFSNFFGGNCAILFFILVFLILFFNPRSSIDP